MSPGKVLTILKLFKLQKQQDYHIIKIGLFGSVAKGNFNADSDIDVVVELEKPEPFDLIGIKQDLEEQFHRSVDIVRFRKKMNPFLKKRIQEEAVYV